MFKKNVSGQFLFFDLVSVLSGYPVTGFSGLISGTRWVGTGNRTVLSGNIVEVSGGMYRANLFDWDTSGDYIAYYFTASGCVPRSFMVITDGAVSGRIYPASGVNTVVPPASLSGVNVTVPIATISGTIVSRAALSGVVANSGLFVNATATLASGDVYLASGLYAPWPYTQEGTIRSGAGVQVQLAANAISGTHHYLHQILILRTGTGAGQARSIIAYDGETKIANLDSPFYIPPDTSTTYQIMPMDTVGTISGYFGSIEADIGIKSGQRVLVYSGQLSGHAIDLLSGRSYTASGIFATATATIASGALSGQLVTLVSGQSYPASGVFVNATATVTSGQVYLASGHAVLVYSGRLSGQQVNILSGNQVSVISGDLIATLASGTTFLASGHSVFVYSGQLSGHQVDLLSGRSFVASGINVVGAFSLASGAMSGQPISLLSGSLSGQPVTLLSGRSFTASGINVIVPAATISGAVPNVLSGLVHLASGQAGRILSGQLSGHVIDLLSGRSFVASGINAVVPIASISGTNTVASLLSGQTALVASGQLSGHQVDLLSGRSFVASGINVVGAFTVASGALSGQQVTLTSGQSYPASGVFVNATATVTSGAVYLASGHNLFWSGQVFPQSGLTVFVHSGQLSGYVIDLLSGRSYTASGIFAVTTTAVASGTTYLASGHNLFWSGELYPQSGLTVRVASGQLSGHAVDLLSGRSFVASGINTVATTSVASGTTFLASGHSLFYSGQLYPNSGLAVLVQSGQLSGQQVMLTSGQSFVASGINSVVPIASISGINTIVPPATLSGVVPNVLSGQVQIASGPFVVGSLTLASGSLSGQQVTLTSGQSYTASGIFAAGTATVASGSMYLASGHFLFGSGQFFLHSGGVRVQSGQLSGHVIDLLSGMSYPASGVFVNATATVTSGAVYLASGHNLFWSGEIYPQSGLTVLIHSGRLSGYAVNPISGSTFLASGHGLLWSGQLYPQSGLAVLVQSGQLSGHQIDLLSGRSFVASGVKVGGFVELASGALSGQQVTLTSGQSYTAGTIVSGEVFLASGHHLFWSGQLYPQSGLSFSLASGALSGQQVSLVSGQSYTASGIYAAGTTASGMVYLASGHFLFGSGQIFPASGVHTVVPPASLSGVVPNIISGQVQIASGPFVNATATVTSGAVYLASGSQILLHSGGLDNVVIEDGMNARQALSIAAAGAAGKFSGAGTTMVRIDGAGVPGTQRIAATVDASGNRTSVTLNLPG